LIDRYSFKTSFFRIFKEHQLFSQKNTVSDCTLTHMGFHFFSKYSSKTQKIICGIALVAILLFLTMCKGMSWKDIGKGMLDHQESTTERLTDW